jgi:AcrR family transcriptional regulator
MEDQLASPPPRVGRPRKFDSETERRMVMDAALRVMARSGYADTSVGEVLSEAGLSTRAFYRHFDSKQDLLVALMQRDTLAVGRSLEQAVKAAGEPVAAIGAWLDAYLDVFYEPRRAARVEFFSSSAMRAAYPMGDAVREIRTIHCRPLIEALRAGHGEGSLVSPTPEADAYSLYALVGAAVDRRDGRFRDRAAAREHVMRFAWPALGLEV